MIKVLTHCYHPVVYLVSPAGFELPEDIMAAMRAATDTQFQLYDDLAQVISAVDVLYMCPLSAAQFPSEAEFSKVRDRFRLTPRTLVNLRDNATILLPFPRTQEIAVEVDSDPRCATSSQLQNGLFMRMAMLAILSGKAGSFS